MKKLAVLISLVLVWSGVAFPAKSADSSMASQVDIPFEKFVLDNGLTLIVHEDHKAPIVGVNVWYHVGSKNEKPGRTGFAHLFEHLMFNGTEHWPGEFFEPLEEVGATGMNGTTNADRTNYFENVPTNALDLALWLESDRMGHMQGAITKEKLDEQRGVVQNEKRQGENQPYGRTWTLLTENTYPAGHPYSWSTIGSMEDLDAAELDDVKEWFKTYYGAANAVLSIAGDVDAQEVKKRVEHYFGDIPSGPPVDKQEAWIAKMTGTHRQQMQDRVPQARIYRVWNVPQWGTREAALLGLAGRILGRGKTSRLYKRLVYQDQIATDASAYVYSRELGGQFQMISTAHPSKTLGEVERALAEEVEKFIQEGPTQSELDLARTQIFAGFVRGLERVGGFGGKSDTLAANEVYGGSPDTYKKYFRYLEEASPEDLRDAARDWLSDGDFILEVHPFPKYSTADSGADRDRLPDVGEPPPAEFPRLQKANLSSGLKVILAERHAVPIINFRLLMDAGYAADLGGLAGTANLTADMMDEGTSTRSALEISEEAARLGASIGSRASLDDSTVSLSALKSNLVESLDLYADVVLNPSFPEKELERLRRQLLAQIQREKVSPVSMALRVMPKLIYGAGHAYGNPLTGSGTEETAKAISRDQLKDFHATWYRPNNATLIVVGDTTLAEIEPQLERVFKPWQSGPVPEKQVGRVDHHSRSQVYLMDRPGSQQSLIFAGHVAPPTNNPDEIALITMNRIIGGSFTSRINMNLREEKHWSYGARTLLLGAKGQRPFIVYAPVQTDKTKESAAEIDRELREYRGDRPATAEELDRAQKAQTLSLPGRWETSGAVGGTIAEIVRFGLPDDYYRTFPGKVRALDIPAIQASANDVIRPDQLVWVIVGDLSKIEEGVRELNLGELKRLDQDGNVINPAAQ